jgi:iron complex outermembrane receptor protein
LTAQFSYQQGTQTEGFNEIVGLKWDFYTIDALVEYSLTIKDKLTIKPGLNFRRALFDDTPYYDESAKQGFLNKRRSIDTRAGYLRTDYLMLKDKLRLIAALRIDKFNFPEDLYFSYQFGANYKFNDRNLLRVVFARANRSANVVDTHVDRILAGLNFFVEGNQETKLLIADMAEAGYRVTIGDNLQLDLEAFYGWSQNFSDFINKASDPSETRQQTLNTPLKTRQSGITLSLNYVLNRLQFKPFVSYQCTRLVNSSLYPYLEDAPAKQSNNNNPTLFNLNSGNGTTIDHEGTPAWYGGFFLNYQPSVKWNLNLSSYFFTDQKYYYFMNTFVNDGTSGIGEVNSKFLLNFKASYRPTSSLSVSVNLRNLLNQQGNEYFNTDKGAIYVLGGISFDF